MRLNRFLRDFDFSRDTIVSDDRDLVMQIRSVLKLATGDPVALTDGEGNEVDAVIQSVSATKIVFEKNSEVRTIAVGPSCTLYCALIKNDRFEYIAQKATEIGVAEIVPVVTRRTVKQRVRVDRLATIAREAVEQSGRVWMPRIKESITFALALREVSDRGGAAVFCDPGGDTIFSVIDSLSGKEISLFIGPEGGWDDEERMAASDAKCKFASLGNSILRSDTAAIVATFVALQYRRT